MHAGARDEVISAGSRDELIGACNYTLRTYLITQQTWLLDIQIILVAWYRKFQVGCPKNSECKTAKVSHDLNPPSCYVTT